MPTILLVEDNEMNRDMLCRRLERRGYTVRCAADGQEGLDRARALTAHAMAQDEQQARAAGCDDFDTKPVELPRLLAKIEALLRAEADAA